MGAPSHEAPLPHAEEIRAIEAGGDGIGGRHGHRGARVRPCVVTAVTGVARASTGATESRPHGLFLGNARRAPRDIPWLQVSASIVARRRGSAAAPRRAVPRRTPSERPAAGCRR
ncbi:MAG: hypothetical protein QOK40_401 [Miltoncostaeaceae bacterium]|jgi:hypothetical protein|nr:hypothetical protein [Miltoncostaeaceae bacterium]